MSKKLSISLAPLVVIAAFAMNIGVAQAATPHYFKNTVKIAEGTQVAAIGWGTLQLNSAAGDVSCHNAVGGFVENPTGGGPGIGETQQFATWDCNQSTGECKTVAGAVETRVVATADVAGKPEPLGAAGAGWPAVLEETEAPTIRGNTATGSPATETVEAAGVKFECFVSGAPAGSIVFYGHSTPKLKNGTTAGKPTLVEFGAGSGELEALGGAVKGTTTGKAKTFGYEEQELLTSE